MSEDSAIKGLRIRSGSSERGLRTYGYGDRHCVWKSKLGGNGNRGKWK